MCANPYTEPRMGTKDPRVDAYIDKAGDFAKPILNRLRKLVHEGCPQVEETIKWGVPHFMYKGMLCSLAAFKNHCAFGFWKGKLLTSLDEGKPEDAWGQFGRLTKLDQLPPDKAIVKQVQEAARLNEEGVKAPPQRKKEKEALKVPTDLVAALKKNPAARATFERFSPSHKRDYIEWITEAKTDATRQKRLATALGWLAEGKSRNWKYERKQ
jgi:uncharacterized protein YdeI (YjbR/CyaY-like superfamily)